MNLDSSRAIGSYVPLAVTERSGHPESVHHGALVALERDGRPAFAFGDVDQPIFPRSSMKPI